MDGRTDRQTASHTFFFFVTQGSVTGYCPEARESIPYYQTLSKIQSKSDRHYL
jgi:hypothetical protein